MLFATYVRFHDRLLGNSCALGLRYVILVEVPIGYFSFFRTSAFGVDFSSDCKPFTKGIGKQTCKSRIMEPEAITVQI